MAELKAVNRLVRSLPGEEAYGRLDLIIAGASDYAFGGRVSVDLVPRFVGQESAWR